MSDKPTNPKDAIGATKLDYSCVPKSAIAFLASAMYEGKVKYGAHNYREGGVRASIYYSAGCRHRDKWWEGQNADPVSRVHHLANSMACDAILLDAEVQGVLNDDRPIPQDLDKLLTALAEVQQHLTELHKDKNPKHHINVETRKDVASSAITAEKLNTSGKLGVGIVFTPPTRMRGESDEAYQHRVDIAAMQHAQYRQCGQGYK